MDGSVLSAPLQNLLAYFQKAAQFKSGQRDAALTALEVAISATLKYVERSNGQKHFDQQAEFQIARLWGDAGIKVRHVSRELASRLQDKADYWAGQLEWAPDEVLDRIIRLVELRDEYRKLLRES